MGERGGDACRRRLAIILRRASSLAYEDDDEDEDEAIDDDDDEKEDDEGEKLGCKSVSSSMSGPVEVEPPKIGIMKSRSNLCSHERICCWRLFGEGVLLLLPLLLFLYPMLLPSSDLCKRGSPSLPPIPPPPPPPTSNTITTTTASTHTHTTIPRT